MSPVLPFASIRFCPFCTLVYFYTSSQHHHHHIIIISSASSLVPLNVVIQFILLCVAVVVAVILSVNKPENLYHLGVALCCGNAMSLPSHFPPFDAFLLLRDNYTHSLDFAVSSLIDATAVAASIRLTNELSRARNYVRIFVLPSSTRSLCH